MRLNKQQEKQKGASKMRIAVKCISCNWVGNAEVGRRKGGVPLTEQQCPKCGSEINRRKGTYVWGDELAESRKEQIK